MSGEPGKLEVFSHKPEVESKDLESAIVTGRDLSAYGSMLAMKPQMLASEKVLNFGSGYSNLGKALEKMGIQSTVVDIDLDHRAAELTDNIFKAAAIFPLEAYVEFFSPNAEQRQKVIQQKKKILDTVDRNFIQGNGRDLPFADKTFDHVFGLWSVYQVPTEVKGKVFKELMRVGNYVHLAPIFKNDFELLTQAAAEEGFEVVVCKPTEKLEKEKLQFESKSDYQEYISTHSENERIEQPVESSLKITRVLGVPIMASIKDGSTIVLQRRSK